MPLASEALSPNQLSDTAGRQARGSGSTTSRFTFKNLQVLENIIFIKLTSVTFPHYELEIHIQIFDQNNWFFTFSGERRQESGCTTMSLPLTASSTSKSQAVTPARFR